MSDYANSALADALQSGSALLKFISPNDANATGAHQTGFYLPIRAWEMFTPQPPENGVNHDHEVNILWQNGQTTRSVVKWYGNRSRHEYRLTRFGREFPFLNADAVGSLLVLVPSALTDFHAYVLDLEEDSDFLQASLGVEIIGSWGIYSSEHPHIQPQNGDECVRQKFDEFANNVTNFPTGETFSSTVNDFLLECIKAFPRKSPDAKLLQLIKSEYDLFKMVERHLCEPAITQPFATIEDFLAAAISITNRRKARAGRSLENHFASLLREAEIPFESQPHIDGRPDLVIPSVEAYENRSYPTDKLFIVGLKTTCKDRWRQVLNEGRRVPHKHLTTLQQGISSTQLAEMHAANVSLVVPAGLHHYYPTDTPMNLIKIEQFIDQIQDTLRNA